MSLEREEEYQNVSDEESKEKNKASKEANR
jgi:hypothetical protein